VDLAHVRFISNDFFRLLVLLTNFDAAQFVAERLSRNIDGIAWAFALNPDLCFEQVLLHEIHTFIHRQISRISFLLSYGKTHTRMPKTHHTLAL